ncbi:MAG TPA: hypothetical protein VGX92_21495 [Pyrinomonadaceae bacterium]|jgi:hypothetical protein|nr:hypothetical protein [Pyrinomonadaceae bacterium]
MNTRTTACSARSSINIVLGLVSALALAGLQSLAVGTTATAAAAPSAVAATAASSTAAQNLSARTPSETVREFYKALSERRFREAFGMSTLKPAIEGLSKEELEDLRPDFEKMAAAASNIVISGEQVSGDTATVFVKMKDGEPSQPPDEVSLMRVGDAWIVGDKMSQDTVSKEGRKYFFKARIDTHHSEAQSMLQRISVAELVYSQQHDGLYGDLAALIAAGLVPKDLEGTESTGYRFHITLGANAKSFTAGAEPARYGRTGRLSFFMDKSGIRSADTGGKPLAEKK